MDLALLDLAEMSTKVNYLTTEIRNHAFQQGQILENQRQGQARPSEKEIQ